MNLLDHFHPPLKPRRHWHGFHNAWATSIASSLNTKLPAGYFAEPNVQFGIEIDVATFEETQPATGRLALSTGEPTAAQTWAPPAPSLTVPMTLTTDVVEVLVYEESAGPTIAGAIELVSPSNKDREAHREAFVAKCETYPHERVGLVVIDIVTERTGNLHEELMSRLSAPGSRIQSDLYAVAYRPVQRDGQMSLDVWEEPLAVGQPLPTMPLWLRGGICVPVELAAMYERTCRELRIGA